MQLHRFAQISDNRVVLAAPGDNERRRHNARATNWTTPPDHTLNDAWQSQVGVFAGTGAAVTVVGQQAFQGLQFAAVGYQIDGGPLLMTGDAPGSAPTQSFVTVDAGPRAGIGSVIGGNAGIGLRKRAGTLVLSGANTYAGGRRSKAVSSRSPPTAIRERLCALSY